MQPVPNRSFSPKQKQSKPITLLSPSPQTLQSLIKRPFKFKFTETKDQIRIKEHQIKENPQISNLKKMASLQRFKLLATQCGVAQSPTRSPRTSPIVHLRRRKTTLRMLLSRKTSNCRSPRRRDFLSQFRSEPLPEKRDEEEEEEEEEEKALVKRSSLKDLFVSSPPLELEGGCRKMKEKSLGGEKKIESSGLVRKVVGGGLAGWPVEPGSPRPIFTGYRCRSLLLRRAWRPVLVSIPE